MENEKKRDTGSIVLAVAFLVAWILTGSLLPDHLGWLSMPFLLAGLYFVYRAGKGRKAKEQPEEEEGDEEEDTNRPASVFAASAGIFFVGVTGAAYGFLYGYRVPALTMVAIAALSFMTAFGSLAAGIVRGLNRDKDLF